MVKFWGRFVGTADFHYDESLSDDDGDDGGGAYEIVFSNVR